MPLRILCFFTAVSLLFTVSVFSCEKTGVYRHVCTDEKKIALTFDDGPHYKYTEQILDILKKYGVKATFFVIGVNAEKYPQKVKRISDEGHEIGNHTYSHLNLRELDEKEIRQELIKGERAIQKITKKKPKLLRPPGGAYSDLVIKASSEMGCDIILWSQDTRDWAHTPADKIVCGIMDNVKGGDIILFHDFVCPDTPTPEALEKIIPKLLKSGYEFVTVSELIDK